MLAAGADAFLRGDGAGVIPGLGADEDVLELDHAGVGEHQRRVVARNQRARRNDFVTIGGEIVEERLAYIVDRLHGR